MNKTMIVLIGFIMATISARDAVASMYGLLEPKANEAAINPGGVEIPIGRMLLIRKDTHCCALKFTQHWTEIDEKKKKDFEPYVDRGIMDAESAREAYEKKYAAYDVYYQGDGSADFSRSNVVKSEHISSWLPLKGPFRPFIYQPGDSNVMCGPFKLGWVYKTGVSYIPAGKGLGDFGFELAPTPWTDISQVNVFDPRVKWYRYDEKRERIFVPIEKLWDDKGNVK